MGPVEATAITLRFHGDDLDPRELTERLGAPATFAVAKGGISIMRSGTERIARTGSWRLKLEPGNADTFNDQIVQLFAGLTKDCATWRELSERYRGNLFVGVFLGDSNEALLIRPETSFAIGERGLALDLDIYERKTD